MFKFSALILSLLAARVAAMGGPGNCDDGFKCADCLKCKSKTADGSGTYTVVIDGFDCKGGQDISWMCAAEDGVTVEGATDENKNDQGLVEMTVYGVPGDWTTMTVQTKDGQGDGTDTDPLEQCGGQQGLDDTCSGACHTEVDLTTCDDSNPVTGGDPHVKSWTGQWYDYHGECDLKLVHMPMFDGKQDLDIDARTKIQFNMYSHIESAAIRIGEDILEVSSWGEYAVNGVDEATIDSYVTPALRKTTTVSNLGGYPIFHTEESKGKHSFDIILSEESNITISNFKQMVNVKINHSQQYFKDVSGLMGNIHGQMLARDGVTDLSQDMVAFGQEWQVRDTEPMLFRAVREPQYPAKCILPDMEAREARRLGEGISEEAARAACARFTGASFDACVYDVTATNDLDQAHSGVY